MTPIVSDLHVRIWGEGNPERVVLLHGGNVPDPMRTWQAQEALADYYEVVVPDRRGYGDSRESDHITWESEVADVLALVGSRAHLVGHSFGGVVALLFASRYPQQVRSLVAIEPPAFGLARDIPDVASLAARLSAVHAAAPDLSTSEFLRRFAAAQGEELPADFALAPAHRKGVNATRLGPDPASAPIVVDHLCAATFPKLVASGAWTPEMEAICDRVATLIGAERVIFPGTGHSPQRHVAFNDRIRKVFTAPEI